MKKNHIAALLSSLLMIIGIENRLAAQQVKPSGVYRETTPKINDLVHTKLDVHFDYKKRYLNGKEWVTLTPHFYPTDTLRIDAKGMDIHNISVVKNSVNKPLQFTYDSLSLAIKLDKVYTRDEKYTVYLDYTAKPEN